jgi:hypothetical protein
MAEVDWENGYIDRERWKTKVRARYKLWPLTLQLLKEHRCSDGEGRVLLNDDGLPLARQRIEDGKYKKCDAIKTRFDRLLRATGQNSGRGFYTLRKTGATLIEAIDPAVTSMYLSHSEKEMKRAYAQRDWARLERATETMRTMLETAVFSQSESTLDCPANTSPDAPESVLGDAEDQERPDPLIAV